MASVLSGSKRTCAQSPRVALMQFFFQRQNRRMTSAVCKICWSSTTRLWSKRYVRAAQRFVLEGCVWCCGCVSWVVLKLSPRWALTGCMIETPLGVLRVADICSEMELREKQGRYRRGTARPSLTTLCMGFADLGKELHAPHVPGRLNLVTSAQLCVLAARAYGLMILDGVHLGT